VIILKLYHDDGRVRYWTSKNWVARQAKASRFVCEEEAEAIRDYWWKRHGVVLHPVLVKPRKS
jgi:hypothetical protein